MNANASFEDSFVHESANVKIDWINLHSKFNKLTVWFVNCKVLFELLLYIRFLVDDLFTLLFAVT